MPDESCSRRRFFCISLNEKKTNSGNECRFETYWSHCKEVKMCDFLLQSIFANNTHTHAHKKKENATVERQAKEKAGSQSSSRPQTAAHQIEERAEGERLATTLSWVWPLQRTCSLILIAATTRYYRDWEWESIILVCKRRTLSLFLLVIIASFEMPILRKHTTTTKRAITRVWRLRCIFCCLCDRTILL